MISLLFVNYTTECEDFRKGQIAGTSELKFKPLVSQS